MKKADNEFSGKLKSRFKAKQDRMPQQAGIMGSAGGTLKVPGKDGFIYVTIGDKTVPAFCSLVPPKRGRKVWVGYSSVDSRLYQVLATRSDTPSGNETGLTGYAPAIRYEWLAHNGGEDPLHVHLRAISYLKIGVSRTGGMIASLYKGYVDNGTEWLHLDTQNVDVSAHIPTTPGKCALVLITIDSTGAVVQTKGSEMDLASLVRANLPAKPSGTIFVSGAVRVYYGQTKLQERKTNTDFVDLRFTGFNWGVGNGTDVPIVTSDPASPTDGQMWLLRETTGAIADGTPIGLLLALTYTGNTGSTAPLQLSVWDNTAGTIIRI